MDDRYWSDFAAYYSDDMDEGCRISYKMPLQCRNIVDKASERKTAPAGE